MEINNVQKNNITLDTIHTIELRDVSFSFGEKKVLKNFSMNLVETDNKIFIVGKNGSGKSTLIKLITGILKCGEGQIRVNGNDINSIDVDSMRENISVLFQNYIVFSFSIAQNILLKYHISKDDEFRVFEVLKQVGLYNKVINLQNGIHSKISSEFDDDGIMLSGGELQRIALARVLLSDASLVIFDEPYNSLDMISENEIAKIIDAVSKVKKVIIISHRLSLLNKADKIFVLDDGSIIESGRMQELMERNGVFASMITGEEKV